jgi:oxygen-independent coproporphyrinogen III oxidase
MGLKELIVKYSKPGPRYTSYPTAPQFNEATGESAYRQHLANCKSDDNPIALYVHIPFCETLCYYCGCNIVITKDHPAGISYVDYLVKEIEQVASLTGGKKRIAQISWGGGTPTFLASDELRKLYKAIRDHFSLTANAEVSIEVDPRVTREEQLKTLSELGFNRISLGVQDFSEPVQKAVNRIQSAKMTQDMLLYSRKLGFKGINFDLMYGLPFQTLASFEATIDEVVRIKPDRIALYNYARLPNMIKHQVILEKFPMPAAEERVDIFLLAYQKLLSAGYRAIGMDHYALETDEMYVASNDGRLYRNFMGYTVQKGTDLIGVGASAIGEVRSGFFQNVKEIKAYKQGIDNQGLATWRGCELSEADKRRKWVIQALMCRFDFSFAAFTKQFSDDAKVYFSDELTRLDEFYAEGILERYDQGIRVTPLGRLFVRNVAMIFDAYLKLPQKVTYSRTV